LSKLSETSFFFKRAPVNVSDYPLKFLIFPRRPTAYAYVGCQHDCAYCHAMRPYNGGAMSGNEGTVEPKRLIG
jgi:DNA repair photolyase